jgi:antitoxin (DNA-binding transcriptional repressor) of toxin-antitoxin stability system
MHAVSVEHALSHFDELLADVAMGEEVVIERDNKPVARLVGEGLRPKAALVSPRDWPVLGMLRGQVWMAPDFDETPAGFEDYLK